MTKKEVIKIIDECYRKLDNILTDVDNVRDTVKYVFNALEEIPLEEKEITDEEEEE